MVLIGVSSEIAQNLSLKGSAIVAMGALTRLKRRFRDATWRAGFEGKLESHHTLTQPFGPRFMRPRPLGWALKHLLTYRRDADASRHKFALQVRNPFHAGLVGWTAAAPVWFAPHAGFATIAVQAFAVAPLLHVLLVRVRDAFEPRLPGEPDVFANHGFHVPFRELAQRADAVNREAVLLAADAADADVAAAYARVVRALLMPRLPVRLLQALGGSNVRHRRGRANGPTRPDGQ